MLFTFPSRYWFAIGGQKYLALGGGPPRFPQGFSCPGVLGNSSQSQPTFPYGAITPYGGPFQTLQVIGWLVTLLQVCCPARWLPLPPYRNASRLDTIEVWALPRSLAATRGIEVSFSSSGY